jgi:hypothetical protein
LTSMSSVHDQPVGLLFPTNEKRPKTERQAFYSESYLATTYI